MPDEDRISYPVRLNRYLALKGFATRRGADELIARGRVTIDGRTAKLGDKVENGQIRVEVARDEQRRHKSRIYLAYYKPRGVVTHSPRGYERGIADVSGYRDLYPVGRLDKESEGLIILTDDGRITERLLHPRFGREREYEVTIREEVLPRTKAILEQGILSGGERLAAKRVHVTGPHSFSIVLTEGKKHEVRRMCDALSLTVERLIRVRIINICLGSLQPGQSRELVGRARSGFLGDLGLGQDSVSINNQRDAGPLSP